jgi:hypothetical protein
MSNGAPLDRTPPFFRTKERKEKEEIRGEEARTGEERESVLSCLPELLLEVEMKYLLGDLTSHCMSKSSIYRMNSSSCQIQNCLPTWPHENFAEMNKLTDWPSANPAKP